MKLWQRYGWLFQFVKAPKQNYLHKNELVTRELLWMNSLTKYLISFCIIMCIFVFKLIVLTCKHVMMFTFTIISTKDINMRQMKSQFFNCWYVIFLMKIQNIAWFQYKNFPCCNLSFLRIFYIIMHEGHVFPWSGNSYFLQITRAYIF